MTTDPKPQDPQLGQDEELGLDVLDEVAGGVQDLTINFTFN